MSNSGFKKGIEGSGKKYGILIGHIVEPILIPLGSDAFSFLYEIHIMGLFFFPVLLWVFTTYLTE